MVFSKSNVEKNNFLKFRSADSSICVFAQLKTIEKKGNMSLSTHEYNSYATFLKLAMHSPYFSG